MKILIALSWLLIGVLRAEEPEHLPLYSQNTLLQSPPLEHRDNLLQMPLPLGVLASKKYRDPNWRPDPALKVGDHVPHQINGVTFQFVVINVFWDGKAWRYITIPDNRIQL